MRRGDTRHEPKDLRDTFASQLLTRGVPLGWIQKQLRHGSAAITARYYTEWIEEQGYRNPTPAEVGQLPCDLLAQLDFEHAIITPSGAIR